MRLGSIPFPGLFTLYAVADPKNLGVHSYEGSVDENGGVSEIGRGIMYTCRAGFLDLSHLRESIDIAKYAHDHLRRMLDDGEAWRRSADPLSLRWSGTTYKVSVRLPEWWAGLNDLQRASIAEEAAIRQAQRFAVIVGSWHELGTWYGQETIPPFSEKNSAFTWDDTTSHVVAAIVAGRALRSGERSWNLAVTRAVNEELAELGAVNPACEDMAVERVHGIWWKEGVAVRRDLDTGLSGGVKTPWLVPSLECCQGAEPILLPLPDLSSVWGYDMRGCFGIRIEPEGWLIRKAMRSETYPEAITSEAEIFTAIEYLREAIKAEFGPDADHP